MKKTCWIPTTWLSYIYLSFCLSLSLSVSVSVSVSPSLSLSLSLSSFSLFLSLHCTNFRSGFLFTYVVICSSSFWAGIKATGFIDTIQPSLFSYTKITNYSELYKYHWHRWYCIHTKLVWQMLILFERLQMLSG